MGLLDFLQGDDAQLGLGLLAAGGPSTTQMSAGQRIAGAVRGANELKDANAAAKMKLLFQQSQIDENTSQNAQRAAAIAKATAIQDFMSKRASGQGGGVPSSVPTLPATGVTGGDIGQPAPAGQGGAAPSSGTQANRILGMNLDDITRLHGMGGPDLLSAYKFANEPQQYSEGDTYTDRVTGATRTIPKLERGQQNVNGVISNIPGSVDSASQMAIELERAKIEAAARFQDGPPVIGPDGKKRIFSRLETYGGGANTPPQTPQGQPGQQAGPVPQPGMTSSFQGPAEDVLRLINGIKDPQERANAGAAYGRQMTGGAGAGNIVELSPAEQAQNKANETRLVNTAAANVVRDTSQIAAEKMHGQLKEGTQRALELLQQGPTASGIGSLMDSAANFVGKSTAGADAASKLDTISGWLTANVPRMEGPQSDKDVASYREMAGMVGDRTKPVSQRIGAVQEMQRLQDKYAEMNGGKSTAGATVAPGNVPAPAPKTIKDFGYTSSAEAIKAAQNAILRGKDPAAVWRRVEEMGLSRPGETQGSR